jgi:hypothetical protein
MKKEEKEQLKIMYESLPCPSTRQSYQECFHLDLLLQTYDRLYLRNGPKLALYIVHLFATAQCTFYEDKVLKSRFCMEVPQIMVTEWPKTHHCQALKKQKNHCIFERPFFLSNLKRERERAMHPRAHGN